MDQLLSLLNALPEVFPGLQVPGITASQVAGALLVLILIVYLRGLLVRS